MTHPCLIVVHGASAAGKTHLSRVLAQGLDVTLISKDDIKETLFNHFESDTIGLSDRIDAASLELFWLWLDRLMAPGQASYVVETVFPQETSEPHLRHLLTTHGYRVVQVYCHADERMLRQRYVERASSADRHPGHQDLQRVEGQPIPDESPYRPLDLPGPVLELDTTDLASIDSQTLLVNVRNLLRR